MHIGKHVSTTIESGLFITKVKQLLKNKRWTQSELAQKAGLSTPQLSRLLSGKNKRVQQMTIDKILAAFEVTQAQFFEQSATPETSPPPAQINSMYSDRLPTVSGEFIGREAELSVLDDALDNPNINILQFIAPGGTGKTKLLRHWLNTSRDKAPVMIAWSFYSQGATVDKQLSTSPFFKHALTLLQAEQHSFSSDEEKGDYLANLLRARQCLLVLDGLEPMQHADPANRGELKDRALSRLLKNLAGQPSKLCIITSRIAVYELSDRNSVVSYNLQNLAIDDGVRLLQSLGVKGPQQDIRQAVVDYAGHALALSLLGNLLRLRYQGNIKKRNVLPPLIQGSRDKNSRHAFKVMQAYQDWFAGTAELSLLYLLGMFDHPVTLAALESLWQANIPDLTQGITEEDWYQAIDSLRNDHHIITQADTDLEEDNFQALDCHPLIREYFGQQLASKQPETWKQAHHCLYEYYKALPDKEFPDTLEEMQPLFHAVKHGCTAGLYEETFDDVYWKRICRQNDLYLTVKLGAFGDELATIANFFAVPWDTFKGDLPEHYTYFLTSSAATSLKALGRIKEAHRPAKKLLTIIVGYGQWEAAATYSEDLCQLQITLGNLSGAMETAKLGMDYADNSNDTFKRAVSRAVYARTLHQQGDVDGAFAHYQVCKDIQKEGGLEAPYLDAVWGYVELLIEQDQLDAATQSTLDINDWFTKAKPSPSSLLPLTLNTLNLVRATFAQGEYSFDAIDTTVDTLRNLGRKDLLPLSLITRAALYRETGLFSKAHQDLDEAFDIASPSGMRLYLTDYHLAMAKLLLKQWQQQLLDDSAQAKIQEHIAQAVALIDETGYHRRDNKVAALVGPSAIKPDAQQEWSEEW
ncbi:helix-turn-helix domain-containing protein [Leucothrix sargassi]|nr:helix-turn-helix domain-containing protein [Leucothrix sargassi]